MTWRRSTRRDDRRRDRLARGNVGHASMALCTVAVAVAAGGLAGCASRNGADLARQACRHVERSIALYQASLHASTPGKAATQQSQALTELREALPIASTAAGEAGQYQALMATLAESEHLPESLLVHSLGEQCAAADSDTTIAPTPPPTAQTPPTRPPPTGL